MKTKPIYVQIIKEDLIGQFVDIRNLEYLTGDEAYFAGEGKIKGKKGSYYHLGLKLEEGVCV